MLSIHDRTWYPAKHRHMRQARVRRVMNPISAIRSTACRYAEGCFDFPGVEVDEHGRCKRMTDAPAYYMFYRGQSPKPGWVQCVIDPACRVVVARGRGWANIPEPRCASNEQKGYKRIVLAPSPDGMSHVYTVCCLKAPWQRVALPAAPGATESW